MVSLRRRLPAKLRGHDPAAQPAASPTLAEVTHVPRWLRPSVRAARVASPTNPPPPSERRAPLLFADPVDPVTERLVVRYDLVQLLDRADEALGMPLCELDTGDEIEVIERDAIWAHVRTPDSRTGWVPAMTLTLGNDLAPTPSAEAVAGEIGEVTGDADLPALEELLAIAAERRALMDTKVPAAPDQPRKPAKPARQGKARKSRKTNRPTSTRKKKRR